MNPEDIVKVVSGVLTPVAPYAVAIPIGTIAKAMLGSAFAELAERWCDTVRLYRYERQLSCLRKAEKMARDAGFTPNAVQIKLLFPLLEGASLEEDEAMHTMWTALLTNASHSASSSKVRPSLLRLSSRWLLTKPIF